MAATGYTPIILFNSTTASNTPTTSNLALGELAINIPDGKLFYNKSGTITVLANSNLQLSGAYSTTLTATGTTTVTLPTSGTLISSVTALSGAVTGTPSSTTYLRGDGTWATVTAGVSQIIAGTNVTISPTGGTGAVTINASGSSSSYVRTSFTATASQTTFSVTYTVGYIEVFLNGVLLNGTDYTATNGTSVVLAVGASSGDIVETIAYTINAIGTIAATNITGVLAIANGGTGTSSTTFANLTTNVTGTLPVANGGTGVTSSTGSGSNVLSTSPTLVTPVLGTPTSGDLSTCTADGTNKVGYRNIPQTGSAKTASYTLVAGDVGKFVVLGTSGLVVIPASVFAVGDAISVFNNTTAAITCTSSAITAYLGGTDTIKTSFSLATRGVCTILFVTTSVVVITGNVS